MIPCKPPVMLLGSSLFFIVGPNLVLFIRDHLSPTAHLFLVIDTPILEETHLRGEAGQGSKQSKALMDNFYSSFSLRMNLILVLCPLGPAGR